MRDRIRRFVGRGRSDTHADDRLSALLDDELDDDEALDVTRHVADCGRCLSELEEIRRSRAALRSLPAVDPPGDLQQQIRTRLANLESVRPSTARRVVAAAAASGLLLIAAAMTVGADEPGTVAPPVDVFVTDHVGQTDGRPVLTPVDLGR